MRYITSTVFALLVLLALAVLPAQTATAQSLSSGTSLVPTDPWVSWLTPEDAAVGLATSSTYWQRHYRAAMWRSELRYTTFNDFLRDDVGVLFKGRRFKLEVWEANQGLVVAPGLETTLSVGSGRARVRNTDGTSEQFGWGYWATAGFGWAPFHDWNDVQPELHASASAFGAGRDAGSADDLTYADLRLSLVLRFELLQGKVVDSRGSWNVWVGAGVRRFMFSIDDVPTPKVSYWEGGVGTHLHLGRNLGFGLAFRFPLDSWTHETVPVTFQASFEWVFG